MQSVRNIIAVTLSVAGLFLLLLAAGRVLHEPAYLTVGAVLLVGGLMLAGLYALGDKLGRLEGQSAPGKDK